LGGVGFGKRIILELLTDGRVGIAAQMLGLSEGVLHFASKYSQERKQSGKVIANYQGVHFELARMATHITYAAQFVVLRESCRGKPGCNLLFTGMFMPPKRD
jgi:alkylation response protein AidB-like acyl-CoA dehydrogenase